MMMTTRRPSTVLAFRNDGEDQPEGEDQAALI